jgi:hypothetical protein
VQDEDEVGKHGGDFRGRPGRSCAEKLRQAA